MFLVSPRGAPCRIAPVVTESLGPASLRRALAQKVSVTSAGHRGTLSLSESLTASAGQASPSLIHSDADRHQDAVPEPTASWGHSGPQKGCRGSQGWGPGDLRCWEC